MCKFITFLLISQIKMVWIDSTPLPIKKTRFQPPIKTKVLPIKYPNCFPWFYSYEMLTQIFVRTLGANFVIWSVQGIWLDQVTNCFFFSDKTYVRAHYILIYHHHLMKCHIIFIETYLSPYLYNFKPPLLQNLSRARDKQNDLFVKFWYFYSKKRSIFRLDLVNLNMNIPYII